MVGGLRHYLTLEQRTTALDTYGEDQITYVELGKVWGSVEAVSARERFESQQVKADISHKVIVRFSQVAESLRPEDRITLGARTFEVISVMDTEGRSRDIECRVLERL
jgi:SPP1 family predicted phage head-tail adaptor